MKKKIEARIKHLNEFIDKISLNLINDKDQKKHGILKDSNFMAIQNTLKEILVLERVLKYYNTLPDVIGNEALCKYRTTCNYEKCVIALCKDFKEELSEVVVCEHLNTFVRYDLDKIACVDCRKILED